jgi:hypothetical protein
MRKLIKTVMLLGICFSSFSQEKISYDIYILLKLRSDANMGQDFDDNSKNELYRLGWASPDDKKNLTLKIDENGKIVKEGTAVVSTSPNLLLLSYKNFKNENPPLKIPNTYTLNPMLKSLKEKDLYKNRNVIMFDDFRFYNNSELLKIICNAKNLYVIFEEEKTTKYYFARKVKIINFDKL